MQVELSFEQIAEARPSMKGSVNVWIGPQSYFDARHLVIEDIKPVRIGAWGDR
jgi:hypothetical protein